MALSPSELRLVTQARAVCSGAETHTELGTLSVNVISQIQFPHHSLTSSPTTSDTYSYSFSQCQSMLVRWRDILRPPRYWYWMSRWDVRATRKKPFSCLSGVFDSIGAPERCLEFIEFVIFGLGVKRAPVCCRKPPRQDRHPHHAMTADVQGQPSSCWFFFFLFFESSPSASAYIIHQGNSWKDIYFVNFLIKASSDTKKSPVVTARKT